MRFILLILSIIIFSGFSISCTHDPVDDSYFLDINKIKGGEKPEPPPVLTSADIILPCSINSDGDEVCDIKFDFSVDGTSDPESGTNENLIYYFYYSFTDPADFTDPGAWYDEMQLFHQIAHTDLSAGSDPRSITVTVSDVNKRVYFWITAYDGGRESDHSDDWKFVDL